MAAEPDEIEILLQLARSSDEGARIVGALMRRILEIQEEASEAELLAIVSQVSSLLGGPPTVG